MFEDLKDTIRVVRTRAHQSQAEAAEMVGVSTRTWQAWEAGAIPRPAHRRKLAEWMHRNAKVAV